MSESFDHFKGLLESAISHNASDVHLKTGHSPVMRILGQIHPLQEKIFTREDFVEVLDELLDRDKRKFLDRKRELTLSQNIDDLARVRMHISWDVQGFGMTIRILPARMPIFADWNLPEILVDVVDAKNGIILITGNFTDGKSSTAAALLDLLVKKRRVHLVTIENSIEYVLNSDRSIITQKELGVHCSNYLQGMKSALLEDPDAIFMDEPPEDFELFDLILKTADTGKLIIMTMRAASSVKSLLRLDKLFPENQQTYYRNIIADNIRMISSQFLIQNTSKDRIVPIMEILLPSAGILNLIREGKIPQLESLIEAGSYKGMQTFDQSIVYLYSQNILSYDDALARLSNKKLLQ